MKIKWIICSALAAGLLTGCVCEKGERQACHNKQAKLMAEAKALTKLMGPTSE